MHLLYVDESGSVADPAQKYFVLAGVCVFERKTHWIEQELNAVARKFSPDNVYAVELHGSPMRSGRDGWKSYPLADRLAAIKSALDFGVVTHYPKGMRLFGAVIRKNALIGEDPVIHAFEQLTNRFDLFLKRLHHKHGDSQRGIMLFVIRRPPNLPIESAATLWSAEVPVFLNSKASRLIQLADLVAYALFRFYEYGDSSFYNVIQHCFDSEGGVAHGLYIKA